MVHRLVAGIFVCLLAALPTGLQAQAGSQTWFTNAAGEVVSSYPWFGTAYVRVEDQSRNQPEQWDRIQVQLRSESQVGPQFGGDQESLELLETTHDSGIFTGSIRLTHNDLPTWGDGRLGADPGDPIEAIHQDGQGGTLSSAMAVITSAEVVFFDETGAATEMLLEGDLARVRVFEGIGSELVIETRTVQVRALHSGDVESVTLTETGFDTRLYEGSIPLAVGPGQSGNGILQTLNSGSPEYLPEEVTALFSPDNAYGQVSATARAESAHVTFIDAFGRATSSFAAAEPVGVRVVDHNRGSAQSRDTVTVTVSSWDGGDNEPLVLEETNFTTGIFEGFLPSVSGGGGTPSDGQLRVDPGDQVEARYLPAFNPNVVVAQAAITGNAVRFLDAAGQPAADYLESSRAYVQVVSFSGNVSGSIDTVSVQLLAELSQDAESLTLTETGPSTALFEGSIPLAPAFAPPFGSPPVPGNSVLETTEWGESSGEPYELDTLRATFSDPAGTSVSRIGLTGSRTWLTDASGRIISVFAAPATVYVRVEDQNHNPAYWDMTSVKVRSRRARDEVYVTLWETGPNTGVFVGSTQLAFGFAQPDNRLQVLWEPEQIEAVHMEDFGFSVSRAVADIAMVAAEFLDETGQPTGEIVESGRMGVRVYSWFGTDPLPVQSRISGDEIAVQLTETGPNTGIFEGSVPMEHGPADSNDDVLQTLNSGSPEYRNDELTILDTYPPVSATVAVVPSRVAFMNLRGQETSAYAPGAVVQVRVTDHNRDLDPGQAETLSIEVRSLVSNDIETITLTETGSDTGVFEGSVPSTDTGTAGADGILVAPPGRVEAAHGNAHTPNKTFRQVTILSTPAPVAVDDTATVLEDNRAVIEVLANDSGTAPLWLGGATQPAHGSIEIWSDEGQVAYTPAADYNGPDTFTYVLVDGQGGEDVGTVTVTVLSDNQAPTPANDAATTLEDQSVAISVLANDTDPNNDPLRVVAVTQLAAGGTVVIHPDEARVTYTPAPNTNGQASFQYTVRDPEGLEGTATVTVSITAVNDPPVANDDSATTLEETPVGIEVKANDFDVDSSWWAPVAIPTMPAHGTVAIFLPEGIIRYTPEPNFTGTDTFTYRLQDIVGAGDNATVTITVTGVNDAPVANADTAMVAEDGSLAITVLSNDTDVDNDTLNVTSVTQGAHGAVVINPNQTVTYTPVANYSGGDSFTYTVSDGNGGTATATVTVTVDSVNDAPTANPDAATVVEDGSVAVTVLANDSDPENNTLNVASVTQGAHGSVVINPNKTVTYAPAANYNGGDSFTYTINDGNGGTATATVTVTITAVNDAPVAVNDTATTLAETLVDIPVLANDVDVDGPSLSVQSVTPPAHGTVSINANQTVRYTPASGYTGADSFTYIARDGVGGTATATVSITVNAPPRVTTNLQVLYGFNEGSGTAVTDTSGVGTPLNLTIGSASAVTWISGGLQINSATLIQSAGAATKVITASQSTNAITLEAWINPLNTSQTGPLATVSQQANKQNFSLGQSTNRWDGHLRTSSTNNAGTGLTSAAGTATLNKTHVVYTRDASGNVRIYVNGVQSTSTTLTGTFSNWTSTYKLGLVNELGAGSPWLGKLYLVAIYNRALSSTEARQNWLAGE